MPRRRQHFIALFAALISWLQIFRGGRAFLVNNNADKAGRNMDAESRYGNYLSKRYNGSRHLGISGSRDVDTLGWGYGTHVTPLVTAVLRTKGDVLELGCGDFSTPILDAILGSLKTNRVLYSTDGNLHWLKEFSKLKAPFHKFRYVAALKNGEDPKLPLPKWMKKQWSVVLIDQSPAQRRRYDIKRLRPLTEVFVIHDTSAFVEHIYRLDKVISSFKYSFIYPRYTRSTTIVSDTIDVEAWFTLFGRESHGDL